MRTTTTPSPMTKGLTVTQRGKRRFVSSQTMRGKLVYTVREEQHTAEGWKKR